MINLTAMEVLELYKNKAITENQFLVELINILAAEKRAERDTRLKEDYLTFEKNTKEFIKNNKEILRKMIKNATDKKETDGD